METQNTDATAQAEQDTGKLLRSAEYYRGYLIGLNVAIADIIDNLNNADTLSNEYAYNALQIAKKIHESIKEEGKQ